MFQIVSLLFRVKIKDDQSWLHNNGGVDYDDSPTSTNIQQINDRLSNNLNNPCRTIIDYTINNNNNNNNNNRTSINNNNEVDITTSTIRHQATICSNHHRCNYSQMVFFAVHFIESINYRKRVVSTLEHALNNALTSNNCRSIIAFFPSSTCSSSSSFSTPSAIPIRLAVCLNITSCDIVCPIDYSWFD